MLLQSRQRLPPAEVRRVVREHPWAILVTDGEDGLLASHMPAVLDEDAGEEDALVILEAPGPYHQPRLAALMRGTLAA
jgi:predicted FMN-binding regulatory protein PaiB